MIINKEINDKQNKDKSLLINNNGDENPEVIKKTKENDINIEQEQKIIDKENDFNPIMKHLYLKNKKNKLIKKIRIINDIKEEENFNNPLEPEVINPTSLNISPLKLSKSKLDDNKYNSLINLEPFFTDFNNNIEKKGKEIIKEISNECKEEKYEEDKVIFRYGEEADRFFIINKGEVSLYFPFTERLDMNIDEYYIYILRLRRYNEIEMLNNVLLLNHGEFMVGFDEGFNIDIYINKLYNTYLKLKFEPTFLYKEDINKRRKNRRAQSVENDKKNLFNNILYRKRKIFYDQNSRFDNNLFETFNEREIKELTLRIGDEILETMKWAMPEKIYNIIEERKEDHFVKKIVKISDKIIQKYKEYNSNDVNEKDYYTRILPICRPSKELIKKNILIMKYLYIDTRKRGQYFGDFCPDSLSLFSPENLSIAKSSRINLKIHQFHHFRNMSAITASSYNNKLINTNDNGNNNTSQKNNNDKENNLTKSMIEDINKEIKRQNKIYLFTFNKKIFLNYFSKFIQNFTSRKKNFLLYNSLFLNTNNKNLIKTYSICFKEKKLKEGEYIFKENDKLIEPNIYIYFVAKGEFQSNCKKSINQIDEIIKLLGHGKSIPETFPKMFKNFLNTPFYDELVKKPLNLKLNYLTQNDIIGLSETFTNDEYFNNVQCANGNSTIYYVDIRIIKLLVDSDPIINNNKNIILYHKYEMLSDILLKQRKIYFDSFFNSEKYSSSNKNKIINNNNKIDDNITKNNFNDLIDDNYNIIKDEPTASNDFITIPKLNKIMHSYENKINILSKNQSTPNIFKNNNPNKKIKRDKTEKDEIKNIGDLDKMLANLNGRFTLKDKRIEQRIQFRKKYKEKIEQLEKEKKLKEEEKLKRKKLIFNKIEQNKENNIFHNKSFYEFKKSSIIYGKMFRVLPLLPNKDSNLKSEGEYKLIIPYKKSIIRKSNSAYNINPLAYDDFNRSFNTIKYFNLKYNKNNLQNKAIYNKKDFDYTIQFKCDINLNKRKNTNNKSDILTQKLRNIYNGKLEKVLNNGNRLKKIL